MKALILAAGFGKRLLPYTKHTPKPLFTIDNKHLLDSIIEKLISAGCDNIIINVHHLHQEIESFIANKKFPVAVQTIFEHEILGTGGAIKNILFFLDNNPFIVINSDIVTDIDIKEVYEFHLNHNHLVTLVLHDYEEFNNVSVTKDDFIIGFKEGEILCKEIPYKKFAFTGIQVISPNILKLIPENIFYSSIDLFRNLINSGEKIKAFINKKYFWIDIGTPDKYIETALEIMAKKAYSKIKLKGDGSDRIWYRLKSEDHSVICAFHGIKKDKAFTQEADSFVYIGKHLHSKGLPVPEIINHDTFSGIVFVEDLGDLNLQELVKKANNYNEIFNIYKSIINKLIKMSILGLKDFNLLWTYQSKYYDKELILERECRYFLDAFLYAYKGMKFQFEELYNEFSLIAERALLFADNGFMHRDFQSRNIMVTPKGFYFIDFQGGRIGPIQYDLASLLIDPYVELPDQMQKDLLEYFIKELSSCIQIDKSKFILGYRYCSITRNLQMLGAFGYLSKVKNKKDFEAYIPIAVKTLKKNLSHLEDIDIQKLISIVNKL